MGLGPAAQAAEPDSETPLESVVESFDSEAIEDAFAESADDTSAEESAAVDSYLEALPDDAPYVGPEDLQAGTLVTSSDLEAVVVAPRTLGDVERVSINVDAEAGEIQASVEAGSTADDESTGGPGAGSWQKWNEVPDYIIQLNLKSNGQDIGWARFTTRKRKYDGGDGDAKTTQWQVGRLAVAQPGTYVVNNWPDIDARVSRLYIGSNLTDATYAYHDSWMDSETVPLEGFKTCKKSVLTLPDGFAQWTPSSCDDLTVFQGRVGHYRLIYDQGTLATDTARKTIAYVAGYKMKQGHMPYHTWRQEVTFRFGTYAAQGEKACVSTDKGPESGTKNVSC